MKRELLSIFLMIALILLLLSIIVHVVTFFGIDPQAEFPAVWLLHFGIFLIFAPLLIIHGKEPGGRFGTIKHELIMKYMPEWMSVVSRILVIYAVVNFGLCLVLLEAGSPDIWEGRYVLQNRGQLIRELTREQYEQKRRYEVRMFSGHWLIFYFYPIAAYCSHLHKQEEGTEGEPL